MRLSGMFVVNLERVLNKKSTVRLIVIAVVGSLLTLPSSVHPDDPITNDPITLSSFVSEAAKHTGKTSVYVLDQGEQALLARAWLTDNA